MYRQPDGLMNNVKLVDDLWMQNCKEEHDLLTPAERLPKCGKSG